MSAVLYLADPRAPGGSLTLHDPTLPPAPPVARTLSYVQKNVGGGDDGWTGDDEYYPDLSDEAGSAVSFAATAAVASGAEHGKLQASVAISSFDARASAPTLASTVRVVDPDATDPDD